MSSIKYIWKVESRLQRLSFFPSLSQNVKAYHPPVSLCTCILVYLPPCLLVSMSTCLRVPLFPCILPPC